VRATNAGFGRPDNVRTVTVLSPNQVEHFRRTGWLLTDLLEADGVVQLRSWVDDIAAWPDDGPWLHYREQTDRGPQLCRSENLVPFHEGLRRLLTSGPLLAMASDLLGEPAVLYKEKINYKQPGGAGYSPHQDAPAYRFIDVHVSCMVAVDDATLGNGCLEVVSGMHHELLPMDANGCITAEVVEQLVWARSRCTPGRPCGSTRAPRIAAARTGPTYPAARSTPRTTRRPRATSATPITATSWPRSPPRALMASGWRCR
jgi:hypothetical protein